MNYKTLNMFVVFHFIVNCIIFGVLFLFGVNIVKTIVSDGATASLVVSLMVAIVLNMWTCLHIIGYKTQKSNVIGEKLEYCIQDAFGALCLHILFCAFCFLADYAAITMVLCVVLVIISICRWIVSKSIV